MKKWYFFLIGVPMISRAVLSAEESAKSPETNVSAQAQLAKHVEEQIKREEHYAKTQEFVQGDDYNLSEHEVDPNDLEHIQVDPPMYDFDMNDVYD